MNNTRKVDFAGPCAFLSCLEMGPHTHAICPTCEALRFGNLFCKTCRSTWYFWSATDEERYGAGLSSFPQGLSLDDCDASHADPMPAIG